MELSYRKGCPLSKKAIFIGVLLVGLAIRVWGQAPQKMSFQAVIRDTEGKLVTNRPVGMRISVLRGTTVGQVVFSETHKPTTNANGLVSLEIGSGTAVSGFFAAINWSIGPYFIQTETDLSGGSVYTISSVNQLLSVPYALYAKIAENGDQIVTLAGSGATSVTGNYPNFTIHSPENNIPYIAGPGISINGNLIANTAPDQPITLIGSGATTVTGTYPNFVVNSTDANTTYAAGPGISIDGTVISNTAPDLPITLVGAGAATVTGAYPNFTVTSTDTNTSYTAGTGIAIDGTTIINTTPDQPISLTGAGSTVVTGSYPDFVVTSTGGTVPYTAGPGITINGTEIINAAPDQPITLTGAGATSVTGSYPDFVISSTGGTVPYTAGPGIAINGTEITNAAPDQPITLIGSGTTTVGGTYPNFTISSTETTYTAGAGISINGNEITNTAPDQPITLVGAGTTTVTGAYPNFTIASTDANTTYTAGPGIVLDGTTIINVAPDQPISLTAGPGIVVSGSYPNFTLSANTGHYIGELFGGGIVFYVYDNGQRGFIASLTDLGTVSQWHTGFSNSGATNYYNGSANTAQIVGTQGAGSYAAKVCSDYMAGGFTNWYLPALWELNLLFQNAAMISFKLANDGNPGTSPLTATGSYWSSTQFDNELAYMIYFPDGTPYLDYKNKWYRIRAIRRF